MKEKFRLDTCAGDGVGLERSTDDGKTWKQAGYVNTGAVGTTMTLAKHVSVMMNLLAHHRVKSCPSTFGLESSMACPEHDENEDAEECRKCWDNAIDKAAGEDGE